MSSPFLVPDYDSQDPSSNSVGEMNATSQGVGRPSAPLGVYAVLRQGLVKGSQPPDAIIRATAESARALTGADGVAIALRARGAIICRARAGDLAPELGAQLNAHSGFSGECLRTASILLCQDALNDERVDPEVCRAMGIRSIIAVPLRGANGISGILEGFSSFPHAFGDEQINCLRELASITEEAYEVERKVLEEEAAASLRSRRLPALFTRTTAEKTSAAKPPAAPPTEPAGIVPQPEIDRSDSSEMRRYWVIGVAAIALLLVLGVWLSWRTPIAELPATQVAAATPTEKVADPLPKPSASAKSFELAKPRAVRADDRRTADSVLRAAEIRPATTSGGTKGNPGPISLSSDRPASASSVGAPADQPATASTAETATADSPPAVTISFDDRSSLRDLTMEPTPLPKVDARVSQGITHGELVHKVDPIYPQPARAQRIQGAVQLEFTIADDGRVRNVKNVSGDPTLLGAAANAIRQWRYNPVLLNGKPIEVERKVTVVFRLPE